MKRVVRWLKHLLAGRKEDHVGLQVNHAATDWSGGSGREKKRWSFAKQRRSGADGGARSWGQPAAATAAAESPQARPKEDARAREEKAAVVIQKTFRGYLERIYGQEVRMKTPATPAHRRRLSDSTDSNYERSPRIVEMDTCHLRSRSSRMSSRYNPDHSSEYHRVAAPTPSCSPLPGGKQHQPPRLSFRRSTPERDPRGSKTAHTTTRFAPSHDSSPAKSVEHSLASSTPRRAAPRDRDALVSPRYMAGTASSAARTRCHSAPRQRLTAPPAEAAPRSSVTSRAGASRRSCSHARGGGFCVQCSDTARTAGCSGIGASDEVARDYYLNSFW
ncbi:hypothetical protein PVAP13_5KG529000 [Panicum virgatum]|uniref:Uncharacterized protein n=1 Tax=Panicum virgatum TaxID=38727 RepID=A0A8T0SX02_PANVG|nr:hypothetical protein PVAP13_5KG529000 [Panicum virgatum]KAG2600609.1 hypothetical protein PVAP13_5KG529000 [Panicum virgatum]